MDGWLVTFVLGNLAFFALILWVFAYYRLGRQRQRAEERSRLLERFSSARELNDFLATPRGRALIESYGCPSDPRKAIIVVTGLGVLTLVVGLAFWLIAGLGLDGDDPAAKVVGTLLIAGGVGMMLAAGVSTVLAARWSLLRPAAEPDRLAPEEV